MLADLCTLIREQNFAGLPAAPPKGIYASFIPQEAELPAVRCRRVGHDLLQTLDASEPDDLHFTDVEITVLAATMEAADPIFLALLAWLRNYSGAMGSRSVAGVLIREDLEDVEEPPVDGSDVWRVGAQFTAQIQHKPAA